MTFEIKLGVPLVSGKSHLVCGRAWFLDPTRHQWTPMRNAGNDRSLSDSGGPYAPIAVPMSSLDVLGFIGFRTGQTAGGAKACAG